MKKLFVPVFFAAVFLLFSASAYANPYPSFEQQMYPVIWLIRTLPFNYAVDIVALCAALAVFGQNKSVVWKMLPVYNIPVVVAGYLSDFAARMVTRYPAYSPSEKDPIVGSMALSGDLTGAIQSDFTFMAGAMFLAVAAILIFLFNLAIISYILRLYDIDKKGMLPLSAAIVAVLTSPYAALRMDAKFAWPIPVCLAILGYIIFTGINRILTNKSTKRG